MRKVFVLAAFAVIIALGVACSKGPAEAALKAADEAVAAIGPDAEKFVPDQFKGLTDAVAAARAKFDQGDYAATLEGAKDLPAKAQEVAKAAAAKKDELTAAWTGLQNMLPDMVNTAKTKIEELVKSKKLPKGMDAAKLASLQTDLAGVTEMWGKATAAFQGGDLMAAIQTGNEVKTKAGALMGALAPAPAAPTAAIK
jgi:hypothetical protein